MSQKSLKENTFANINQNDQQHKNQRVSYYSHKHYHYQYDNIKFNILKQQQELAVFLIALLLLQNFDLCMCHHIPINKRISLNSDGSRNDLYIRNRSNALGNISSSPINNMVKSSSDKNRIEADNRHAANKKRRIVGGQPEEIFSFDDRIEANYDEYPMVVPKRAALLLDRLMVALHHALEQERRKLSDFYAERNDKLAKTKDDNILSSDDDTDQTNSNHMYSDDDPSVMLDYDFKDLNSINRATGETLMGKSFQRRGDMGIDFGSNLGNADGVAMLTASTTTDEDIGGGGGGVGIGVGRNSIGNNGRMYWRCYFNAVSCF